MPVDHPVERAVVPAAKRYVVQIGGTAVVRDDRIPVSPCDGSFGGLRMLGDAPEGYVTLLQVPLDQQHTLRFEIKVSDLGYGNWKKARLVMEV